jgi:hypothetical protein
MDPFVSTVDLGAYLNKTIDGDDTLAIMVLDAACQAIRTYTNQDLNLERRDTIQLHGTGHRDMLLPQLPVIEVHSISVDDEVLDEDDWHVGEAGILYRLTSPFRWATGIGNVEVEYTHGWGIDEDELEESGEPDADRMPSDLRMVAVRIAANLYRSEGWRIDGVRQISLGDFSATFASEAAGLIETPMKLILDRYVVKGVA